MEARGHQKDMDIFLEVPRARIGILGLDFLGHGGDLGTFKGFPLADLGAWGGGRQGRSQRGPGPPAEDPCGGGGRGRPQTGPRFHARFHALFQQVVSSPVSWVVSAAWFSGPGFMAGFMPGFMGHETKGWFHAP